MTDFELNWLTLFGGIALIMSILGIVRTEASTAVPITLLTNWKPPAAT